jgi:hypothetical protein
MRIVMEPNRDTTVAVALEIDSLQQRLIKQQLQRLQTRMDNAVGRAYAVSRDEMLQRENMTLWHALYHTGHGIVHRLPPMRLDTVPQCVFVDEREVRTPAFNDQGRIIPGVSGAAQFLFPEDVERVEFYAEGAMVRIYTRRYMARLVSGDVRLTTPSFAQPPRGLSRTASEPICG